MKIRMLNFLVLFSFLASHSIGAERPNIVLIVADDLGWSELGCYGNGFNETPHIDRLATDGMRFTQAYAAAPVCSPYRAALLTGQHPARVGIIDYLRPNSANALSVDHTTLPELLKRSGYRTGMIGKWHLTGHTHHGAEHEVIPRDHGFDWDFAREVKGVGNGANFWPYVFRDQPMRWIDIPDNRLGEEEFLVDRMNLEAVEFIERNKDEPFFLYLSHYAPHTILNGKPELVEKYRRKHPPGKSTHENCYLCKDHGHAGDARNHWAGDHNPHLAAMLESIDHGVGMLRAKLEDLGIADNTIIMFTSDNGGETNVTSNTPLRGGKSQLYEGGLRVPLIVSWPRATPGGTVCNQPTVNSDFYPTLLEATGTPPDDAQHLDGKSMLTNWKDVTAVVNSRPLYWHYPLDSPHFLGGRSSGAIRDGDWKLIEFFDTGELELYDLGKDLSEKRNVAKEHPETARRLHAQLADWRVSISARTPSAPLFTEPRQLKFDDHFSTGQVSSRWFFNGDWEAREGILQRDRTGSTSTRMFAKDLEYKDSIVRFDFQLQQAQDIRFLSGSNGHYNAIVHIQSDHFRIETAKDESVPCFQYWHGECAYPFEPNRWYTMTIEYLGDELVAHIDHQHVAYAQHPILDKSRDYLAFQVDEGSAAFDNVQLLTASKHPQLKQNRDLVLSVSNLHPVEKTAEQQRQCAFTNAHDHLYRNDAQYRKLVERVDQLDARNKEAFPVVFRSHKELHNEVADLRRKLLDEDPRYKELLFATYRADRALDAYLKEQQPEVALFPESRRKRELERLRLIHMKTAPYMELVEQQTASQALLKATYPQLFIDDEQINANRRQAREALRDDPTFRKANDDRAAAWNSQQEYLMQHVIQEARE